MKIAIVCSYYPWPPSVGGVETIVRNVSIELAKRSHEVHVITTPFDVTTMKQVTEYGLEERDGVTIHKLKPGRLKIGYARFIKGLKENMEKIKPEIVHAHNLHPHLFQLAMWKDKLGYRLIAELHHPAVELDFLVQKLVMPLAVFGLKRINKAIDTFVTHTTLEREWLTLNGIPESKVETIRFPAVPSRVISYIISYKGNLKNLSDIVYLGRIVYRKGLHVLLKALSEVKRSFNGIKADIAGPSDPQYLRSLKALVKQYRLEDNVYFVGVIDEGEKYDFIRSHKVLVLPSLKEYTPSILLEAQALGVPVIATKVGAVSEMLINGETGFLVKPGDELELAKAIEVLVKNHKLRERFSAKAKIFSMNFTVEKQVDRLEDLYHEVLYHK